MLPCRLQVGPRLSELVEGERPTDRYYFYDGLKYNGHLVDLKEATWGHMANLWLVHSIGAYQAYRSDCGRSLDQMSSPCRRKRVQLKR